MEGGTWKLGRLSEDEWNHNIMARLKEIEGARERLLTFDEMWDVVDVMRIYYGIDHLEITTYRRK